MLSVSMLRGTQEYQFLCAVLRRIEEKLDSFQCELNALTEKFTDFTDNGAMHVTFAVGSDSGEDSEATETGYENLTEG